MAYPRDKGTYILDTDASDYAIGAVLSQEQDGRENKKYFRNIYAPMVQNSTCTKQVTKESKDIERTTQWAEKNDFTLTYEHVT